MYLLKLCFICLKNGCDFAKLSEEEKEDALLAAGEHEAELLIRLVSRDMKKDGLELRYLIVTSDRDGKTGEHKRVHHEEIGAVILTAAEWVKLDAGRNLGAILI